MYLRSTKRRNQDGTEVEYFQLAHNVRNPRTGKPLAQIIHNFGRADHVDRDSLVRLCRSIARVCGVSVQDLKLDQMYKAMDMLQAHSTAVEEAVFFRTAHLFNLEVDLIFYDTTTAAFAIDEEDDYQGRRQISIGNTAGQPGRGQGRSAGPSGAFQSHCRKSAGQGSDGRRRRRYIACYNPLEAERQQLHREQVLRELEAELAKHPDSKATARWAIDLLASGRYRRYLKIETATNRLAINRRAAREAARTDGKWVLITNDDTITLEDAASGYKSLLVIERCFRTLKSTQINFDAHVSLATVTD